MDAYVFGFVAILSFLLLVGTAAVVFLSIEPAVSKQARYTRVNRVDTNTIEIVDTDGKTQRWQRSAQNDVN